MPANSIFESFLAGQGYALFEYLGGGGFRLLGEWPDWCANIWGAQPSAEQLIKLADRSPFLDNFLVDAEEFLSKPLPARSMASKFCCCKTSRKRLANISSGFRPRAIPCSNTKSSSRKFRRKKFCCTASCTTS